MAHPRFVPLLALGFLAGLLVPPAMAQTPTPHPITGSYEKYGTTPTGVGLYWTAYVPSGVIQRLTDPFDRSLSPGRGGECDDSQEARDQRNHEPSVRGSCHVQANARQMP